MTFWGSTFIFDGIPSEVYNLYLGEIGGSGSSVSAIGADVDLITESIYRRYKPYFYGAQQSQILTFDFGGVVPQSMTAPDAQLVSAWLFGQSQYKKLQIVQNDMQDVYFNCFLKSPQIVREGNLLRGFKCTVTCDSPYAWQFPKVFEYDFTEDVTTYDFTIINTSNNGGYMYPLLEFTTNVIGSDFNLVNLSDNNRSCYLDALTSNETITINNDLQILTSSTGLRRLSGFNKNWFRLSPGINLLRVVSSEISNLKITCDFPRKVG